MNAYKESIFQHAEIIGKNGNDALQFYKINLDKNFYFLQEFIEAYIKISAKYEYGELDYVKEYGFKTIETPYVTYYTQLNYKIVHVIRNTLDVCDSQKRTIKLKKQSFCYLGSDWLSTMLFKRIIPHDLKSSAPNEIIISYDEYLIDQEIIKRNLENIFKLNGLKKSNVRQSRDEYFNSTNSSSGVKLTNQVVKRTDRKINKTCLTQGEINFINYILKGNLNFFSLFKIFLASIDYSDNDTYIQKFQLFLSRGYRTIRRYLS